MPRSALASVPSATTAKLSELPALLDRLVREPAPEPPPIPEWLRIEVQLTERAMKDQDWEQVPAHSTDFTCPQCNGALSQVADGGTPRYRCRVGHAYSADALMAAKDGALEDALWLALQTLQERGQMLERLVREELDEGRARSAAAYQQRAQETHGHAAQLRDLIQKLSA
jgi:two-component system chemotaxis response regulator CheB